MEEYIKASGKTVEDAVLEASIALGTSSDNIEYRVLEHETKGFLGIGAKKAVIEARKKVVEEEDILKEVFLDEKKEKKPEKKKAPKEEAKKEAREEKKEEKASAKKGEKAVKSEKPVRDEKAAKGEKAEKSGRTEKSEKAAKAEKAVKAEKEDRSEKAVKGAKAETSEKVPANAAPSKEVFEAAQEAEKPVEKALRVPADPKVASQRAEEFLKGMFEAMGADVQISTSFEDDTLSVDLSGEDMGVLIGKRGQTLDSVQYLTSLVVNKGKASYVRVKVDTENYRERRKATLENLARNIAFKVKKTRRSVYLEPMNPYERRIIHSALQNDPYVTTHSEGEEPLRKVVVTLRKKDRPVDDEYGEE